VIKRFMPPQPMPHQRHYGFAFSVAASARPVSCPLSRAKYISFNSQEHLTDFDEVRGS